MFFEDRARVKKDKNEDLDSETQQIVQDNVDDMDWKDAVALTVAAASVLAPRFLIILFSYLFLIMLFFLIFV
ncbi:hypothetical protein [Natranaerobius thermophilus]|uniref:Uncharacterized protein n=1 Tax=Natranaerobius thermophilus (strain ATCC BAA-1301 / DSM 18059 / JW/NM-WN-LF) TaxID=457570 RepID=B2A5R5_NATTJ|nr:hypothetical protein [Natranaerobius thermophilus]ACB84078.1 hypothetical protein Nther_0482 [Natranaerobius thermophilus JW/NM-WN-LF]